MKPGSEPIPLSALQHWLFCPRQCALIHVERLWAENRFTAEGRVMHETVDAGRHESRPGVRILRGVSLVSERLGLVGRADVVELRGGVPFPVEYKRGCPKTHRADEVQLCGQAICLEEAFGRSIIEGALFYGKTRRRLSVTFDSALRELTEATTAAVRACLDAGQVPTPRYDAKRCDTCSLNEQCLPAALAPERDVRTWFARALKSKGVPE